MTSSIDAAAADALRWFYRDVLGGREVWSTRACGSLWFLVDSKLIEVRASDVDQLREGRS